MYAYTIKFTLPVKNIQWFIILFLTLRILDHVVLLNVSAVSALLSILDFFSANACLINIFKAINIFYFVPENKYFFIKPIILFIVTQLRM